VPGFTPQSTSDVYNYSSGGLFMINTDLDKICSPDFTDNLAPDRSLFQTGINGYLQNYEALKYLKERQECWNKQLMVATEAVTVGLASMPLGAIPGAAESALTNKLSRTIDRLVSVMEMLLLEFKEEGITITPRVQTERGLIDLSIRTSDGRYFAFLLRSNGDSKVKWREDRQGFFVGRKGGASKWSEIYSLGDRLNSAMLYLKEQKSPLMGANNTERKKNVVKGIILTGETRVDPNNDPALLVDFGLTKALRVKTKSTFYLVNRVNLADFLRKPEKNPINVA
jgi:hypothetical protein